MYNTWQYFMLVKGMLFTGSKIVWKFFSRSFLVIFSDTFCKKKLESFLPILPPFAQKQYHALWKIIS